METDSISFEKIDKEPFNGISIKSIIDSIYESIDSNKKDALTAEQLESMDTRVTELIFKLNRFQQELISFFRQERIIFFTYSNSENRKIEFNFRLIAKAYSNIEKANIIFSQFLQHIFNYILIKDLEENYKNAILIKFLTDLSRSFYYQFDFNGQKKVTLWVDQATGDTVLTKSSQIGGQAIFDKLLMALKSVFIRESLTDPIPNDLERYLFYENKLGRSALSLIWLRKNQLLEKILFKFAEFYYQHKISKTFQKFLFQIDADQNTALMRAGWKGFKRLFNLIINNIAHIYLGKQSDGFKSLLLHENNEGETLLYKLIQGQHLSLLDNLLGEEGFFALHDNLTLKKFLGLDKVRKSTPFIEATKVHNDKIIKVLLNFVNKLSHETVINVLCQQDVEGYTALMRSVEINYQKGFNYLLNELINFAGKINLYSILFDVLNIKTINNPIIPQGELSIFQVAVKASNWEALEELIDLIQFFSNEYPALSSLLTVNNLDYIDEHGLNVLTKLYVEEYTFRLEYEETRSLPEEKQSNRRLKLAKFFSKLGRRPSQRINLYDWSSLSEPPSVLNRVLSFFNILCGSQRSKRSLSACLLSEEDYQASIPENSSQIYKEALINLLSILKNRNLFSIREISIIRNSEFISAREKKLLEEYDQIITQYYDTHASPILSELKTHVVSSLEEGLAENTPYILIDNQQDLLVLGKNKIFSGSLLNPAKFFLLNPTLNPIELKEWLDTYFGPSYTLHPFDPTFVENYPHSLLDLSTNLIISDSTFFIKLQEGIKYQTIMELFIFNGQQILFNILIKPNFFANYQTNLLFRAERFHELFFNLNSHEQQALKTVLYKYQILPANYPQLSVAENKYLTVYGMKIKELMSHSIEITPTDLFDMAIQTHEQVLSQETILSATEKNQIFSELRALKERLDLYEPGVQTKAALQLLILLLPSAIRGIAKKDLMELAAPISFIAADVALREVLIKLANHPQVIKIFSGGLSGKVLGIAGQKAEKVPIVGSALAVFGLYQSGKALINADSNDPNRPYYAHLLVNNLVSAIIMGAGISVSLPYWPVLSLFTVLTVDQLATEGDQMHDVILHLQDDKGHPLLKFYTSLQLGLGIVNGDIQTVLDQRQLFDGFLRYLDKVKDMQGADALVAVFLPEVRRLDVPKVAVRENLDHCKLPSAPLDSNFESNPAIYPQSVFCTRAYLKIDKKADYSFSLGRLNTFCEKRDPFNVEYLGNYTGNYTLLVGTKSKDCSLGQTKTIRAMAETNSMNAAGILVNNQYKENNVSGNYRFFVPIDPRFVKDYKLDFIAKNASESDSSITDLEEWLPCANDTSCITRVRVAITALYTQIASDAKESTKIRVNDDGLRKFANNQGIRSIEYLMTIIDKVTIEPNHIPEQTFAFFDNEHYLSFENNSIKSENGFQAQLAMVKKLTLDFMDKAWIEGRYQVPEGQQLVINQVKGVDEGKIAILDVTQAQSFAINLGQYTQLNDRDLEIVLRGNFSDSALEVYRYKNTTSFYQFLKPIENVQIQAQKEESLLLTVTDNQENEMVLIEIKSPIGHLIDKRLSFSGKYKFKENIFFSRILMYKSDQGIWKCNLEINASMANTTQILDVGALQKQNFDKVSLLTRNGLIDKKTHYLFYQSKTLTSIEGRFVSYQVKGVTSGWLIVLKHALQNEETQCFIGEESSEIIIDKIRYQIRPALATLFAVGTVDNSPINGHSLIADLKIEKNFYLGDISLINDTYQIGNIAFEQLPLNTKIYFLDQTIPSAYIKYQFSLKHNNTILSPTASQRLDRKFVVEAKALAKNAINDHWLSRLNGFFVGIAFVTTGLISGTVWMFIRRFRHAAMPVALPVIPLLKFPGASALPDKEEFIRDDFFQDNSSNSYSSLFKGNRKTIPSNKLCAKDSLSAVNYTSDLNTQLFFANYLLFYGKKYFNKGKSLNLKKEKVPVVANEFHTFVSAANGKNFIPQGLMKVSRLDFRG